MSKVSESISTSNEIISLQKMIFIYNAITSGWNVKMTEKNTFEFIKDSKNQEVNLDNYINNFIINNLNINNIPSISKEK